MQLRARRQMLPAEQEPHEVGGRNRLDFAPQPIDRQPVNARQHPAIAPFDLPDAFPGVKRPAQYLPFPFKLRQPGIYKLATQHQPLRQRRRSRWANRVEPAAQRFGDGVLLLIARAKIRRPGHSSPFRRGPNFSTVTCDRDDAIRRRQLIEPLLPLRAPAAR